MKMETQKTLQFVKDKDGSESVTKAIGFHSALWSHLDDDFNYIVLELIVRVIVQVITPLVGLYGINLVSCLYNS